MLVQTYCISFFKGKERVSWCGNFVDLWKTTLYIVAVSSKVIRAVSIPAVTIGTLRSGSSTKLVHSYFVSNFVPTCTGTYQLVPTDIGPYRLVHEN